MGYLKTEIISKADFFPPSFERPTAQSILKVLKINLKKNLLILQ